MEEYEKRSDEFNIHGWWEWVNGEVIAYELPSNPHEICTRAIAEEIMDNCRNAKRTDAQIYSSGSARKHRFIIVFDFYLSYPILISIAKGNRDGRTGKEADDSFRPEKPPVPSPHGSDNDVSLFPFFQFV